MSVPGIPSWIVLKRDAAAARQGRVGAPRQIRLREVRTLASVAFGAMTGRAVSEEHLLAASDIGCGLVGVVLRNFFLVGRVNQNGKQEQDGAQLRSPPKGRMKYNTELRVFETRLPHRRVMNP